jgi:hypothetical protein
MCIPWVLVLEVELVAIDKPEIMYKDVFEGDENTMLRCLAILNVEHYRWLQGQMLQIKAKQKGNYLWLHYVPHFFFFLQLE